VTDAFADLAAFDLDPANGFLPGEDPLPRLPDAFAVWDRVGADLPALLVTSRARAAIETMPVLDPAGLSGRREEERGLLLLVYLASAFVWGGAEPARRVPASIGRPLILLSERMGRVPIIHYGSTLHNWRRVDPAAPVAFDNLDTPVRFLGGADECWFFQIELGVELEGRDAIPAMIAARRAAAAGDAEALVPLLGRIAAATERMTAMLERTAEWCAPWAFYHRVRPWVASWPAPGLVYEGADDTGPRPYAGGSAAQSALVQAIDVTLGIVHDGHDTSRFLTDMRRYMTPGHRRFLSALGEGASVRDLCARAGGAARDAYDATVDTIDGLRKAHTGIAVRYIINMARDEKAVGTGGTELASFLKATRTETKAARLAGA
jgi:indoleamine 2,3-dioxygenase